MKWDFPVNIMLNNVNDIELTVMALQMTIIIFLISNSLIKPLMKLKGMRGIYSKAIEKWGWMAQQRKPWIEFKEMMKEEFQKMLYGGIAF